MDDITLPNEDDDRLFIRPVEDDEVVFEKHALDDDLEVGEVEIQQAGQGISDLPNAGDHVKIHFARFVQLVANHSFIDIVDKHAESDVIVSGNLLADLANAHDRNQEKRMPMMFVAGLVIGIVLTYIITK